MKRKLLFAIVALLCSVGAQKLHAAAADYLTGWTEVTSLPADKAEWSKYYYVFVATEADLMMAQESGTGKNGDTQEGQLTMVYRTPGDPAIEKKFVWMIDYSDTYLFGIRNLNNSTHFMQTRENATYRVQFAWETAQSKWTMWNLVYADSKWTIQNKLAAGDGGGDNNWIGPWNPGAFQDNMVVAGNAGGNGNAKGTFKIYRIPCKDYMTNVTSTYLTNADFSGSYSQKYTINTNRYIYQPNGWDIDYKNESTWNMTVVASTDAMASNFTGTYAVPADNQKYMVRFRDNKPSEYIDLSQTISAAAGIYTISADMIRENGSKITVKLYADDNSVENSSGNTWQNRSFTASLAEGSVKVGIKFSNLAADGVKAGADNVKMMYKASDKTDLLATIEKAIQLNNALSDATLATAIKTAIGVYRDVAANQTTVNDGNTALNSALTTAYASLSDGRDLTGMITNATVTSDKGWTNGRTGSNQQYTGAPDNTYLDTWNENRNQNQTVTLPEGYYLLKVATRADANVSNGNVYAHDGSSNIGSDNIHREGNTGNLLGNGWAWTRFGFHVDEAKSVSIGFYSECGSSKWAGVDDFHLYYYTTELAMKQAHLAEVVADANAWAGKVETTPALETALSASAPSCSTVEECNTAISNLKTTIANARATETLYAEFNRIKNGANGIKDVEYTEVTGGAYTTFIGAISTQTTAADNATTVDAVNDAINALQTAIKTYITNAEPKNEGEYFDITCLMVNPDFSMGDASGWNYGSAPGVNWSNCEYYQTEFNIYQTVTGLPTGSYSLNVQAFQRPGEASAVYNDYIGGTDNATSVLYINSITSKVKNIAADAQNTYKLGDGTNFGWPNDSRVGTEGNYKYLPNSQEGAKLYFDAELYDATCAAVVTDDDKGSLKLGFKSTKNHVSLDWTIFDNFRLRYYGSSLFVYYKQYLPQLKAEVATDLANATYDNVIGQERGNLVTANGATPVSETEAAYKDVIDDITEKRDAFQLAKSSYDALAAAKEASALTKVSENIGTGVFQYNETTNNTLYSAYETCKQAVNDYTVTSSSTASDVQALVDALNEAIDNYNNQTLNAPDAEKRYVLTIVEAGKAWDGNAVTFMEGAANPTQGNYGIKYLMPTNVNMAQAVKFTATSGNKYKVSYLTRSGNEQYITTAHLGYDAGSDNTNKERIRTTDDASKALEIEIQATTTTNQFKLYNTDRGAVIGNNSNNDMFTKGDVSFTIAEASKASVPVTISAGKYATRIFPFTPELPSAITAYSCATVDGTTLNLTPVAEPAANTPYILFSEEGYTGDALTGYGTSYETSHTVDLLTGFYNSPTIAASANNYVLQTLNGIQAFYLVKEDFTNTQPYRAYITYEASQEVKALNFVFDELPTAINAVEAAENEKAEIYNLAGQRLNKAQKGVNIINGKKVLVK